MPARVRALRRVLHASFALSLAYYAVPDPVPGLGAPRGALSLLGVALVGVVEAVRIRKGWTLPLMRDYERRWVAGYFWLGSGCVLALVLFPKPLAVAAILGTALVDPLIGELRPRLGIDAAAAAGFAAWAALATLSSTFSGTLLAPPLIAAGAAAAVLSEGRRIPRFDDDLLMTLAPLIVMIALGAAIGS